MCITRTSLASARFAIALSVVLGTTASAMAQSASQDLPWPKTFNGQPDFDFKREEIIDDMQENGVVDGLEVATMRRLLQTTIVNPFTKEKKSSTTAQEEDSTKINKAALAALFGDIPENVLSGDTSATNTQLPGYENKVTLDLTEFADFLDNVIKQKVHSRKTNLKTYNFENDLDRVIIQSIVTSPVKYAIINQNRYSVGDRFLLPIQIRIYDSELDALLAPYLPQPESFSEDVYQKYIDIKNEAITKYKSGNSDSKANVVTHNVSVTIRDILHRKVRVSIYGNEYELKIKHAF